MSGFYQTAGPTSQHRFPAARALNASTLDPCSLSRACAPGSPLGAQGCTLSHNGQWASEVSQNTPPLWTESAVRLATENEAWVTEEGPVHRPDRRTDCA